MDFNKFSSFLKENNLDLNSLSKNAKSFTISANGTYAKGSEIYLDGCSLIFSSINNKNTLAIMKKKRQIEEYEIIPEMTFNSTFVQFSTDSFFYSSNSTALAQITLVSSIINSKSNADIKTLTDKEVFISIFQNPKTNQFCTLYTQAKKQINMNFISPKKEIGKIYSGKIDGFSVFYSVFPFVGLENNPILPPAPYVYPSTLPEEIYVPENNDALIQGIVSLSQKIEEHEKELQKPMNSPLEITRIELESVNNSIKQQIKIEKETLKRESTKPASLNEAIADFETTVAHKLNFGGAAAITGKEAAVLLRNLLSK